MRKKLAEENARKTKYKFSSKKQIRTTAIYAGATYISGMNFPAKHNIFILFIASFYAMGCSNSEESKQDELRPDPPPVTALYREIQNQDSLMFAAFNAHDAVKLMSFFSPDLEFYHDKGGLDNYEQTLQNFQSLFENNKTTGLKRELVKASLEVYPIKDFGAVETCLHRFCHVENGKDDCGTFKNVMIWQNKDGQWKVTRVISYDH